MRESRLPLTSGVLQEIEPLLPEIAARAEEIEQLRAVPVDINERLGAAGVYTMLIPARDGGSELHPLQMVQVLQALGRADGSVAWTAMVSSGMNAALARFPRAAIERVFASSALGLIRGATAPKGIAEPVEGGYRVKGRWSLASGSYDYQWVIGNCVVMEAGKPRMDATGAPQLRAVLVPKAQAKFLDTWHAVGLKGSASHDFIIDEAFVPQAHSTDVFGAAATFDTALHRLPLFMIISTPHAAVALGIAQGAIDDLTQIARSKRPAFDPRALKDNPIFNYRFGELATQLEGARAFLEREAAALWDIATSGTAATALQAARTLAGVARVQRECLDIVQGAFDLAGSDACYEASRLQRRWRDMRCLAQHVAAGPGHYERIGQALLSAT